MGITKKSKATNDIVLGGFAKNDDVSVGVPVAMETNFVTFTELSKAWDFFDNVISKTIGIQPLVTQQGEKPMSDKVTRVDRNEHNPPLHSENNKNSTKPYVMGSENKGLAIFKKWLEDNFHK